MDFIYKDVFDFQRKHPTKAGREKRLLEMDPEEIMHIAYTCGTKQGGAYYAKFAEKARFRDLIAPVSEDLEKVWQEGKRMKEEGRL